MAINPALLIAAPILQDYFVDDATGLPLSNGVITCYQDNARTTFKNWYYQSGTPGAYIYIPLPNPLTLSAQGTITDVSGNDTIPFFYPYDETDDTVLQPYYITVINSNGQLQFTRQNFPYIAEASSSNSIPTNNNIITNNVFYENCGTLNATNVTNQVIAPSQHDGLMAASNNDIRFVKNVTGATDNLTFTLFGFNNDPLIDDITPQYYLNTQCSSIQAGETKKCIRIPLSYKIKTLESVNATVTIQAQNVGGNVNNTLSLSILQFLGTNAIATSPLVNIETITLTNSWQKYVINFTFPSSLGVTVGTTGDDAFFLEVGFPLSATFNINFTKPSVFLSATVPTNDFQTYDQIDALINSPRTGDVRTSLNLFQPFGWVLMNDGTIGNASSNATTRANLDTWNLFSLIWTAVGSANAPMFNSSGTSVNYGATPQADWAANNQISLPKQFGRALASAGLASGGGVTNWSVGQTGGNEQGTISVAQLPAHHHTLSPFTMTTGASGTGVAAFTSTGSLTTSDTGSGAAISFVQATTFYNVLMKL